ncbi:MAG: ABC transporter permease, partial [Lachnospiraceae bacterium]|nr:ABC transporter permease [Lachnospiraceae bacterium]
IIYVLYNKVIAYAMERYSMIFSVVHFLPVNEVFRYLFPVCIAVGVGIGFLGSFFTVRKHLRV